MYLLLIGHSDDQKMSVQNGTIINLGRISDATLLMIDNAACSGEGIYIATAYAIKHERIYSPTFNKPLNEVLRYKNGVGA